MTLAPLLLPAFKFEISLIRSVQVTAGSQQLRGVGDADASPTGSDVLGKGGFQECSGLEIEMDIQEYQEGGRNNGVIRRAGRAKFPPLVLKRGMFVDPQGGAGASPAPDKKANVELWRWMQGVINGERPIARYDGLIYVKSADNSIRAT
jgi:phage tail-like protein